MNRYQSKQIHKYIKENRMTDDDIMRSIIDACTINQLTLAEISAIMTAAMRNLLLMQDSAVLNELLAQLVSAGALEGADASHLSVKAVTTLQALLTNSYEVGKDEPDDTRTSSTTQ